jgi:hypothetical protein
MVFTLQKSREEKKVFLAMQQSDNDKRQPVKTTSIIVLHQAIAGKLLLSRACVLFT